MIKFCKNIKKNLKLSTMGFTLVELLAVIVILSVILVIGVPTLVSNIKNQKGKASGYVCDIIKTAAKNYGVDYEIEGRRSISISDLCERYISCPIIDPNTNEEIDGYLLINDDECNFLSTVKLDVRLNGGTPAQSFNERYGQYYTIRLFPPTKENNDFVEWRVVRGNSAIDGNILKFGDTDTEIFAVWESWPTLTIDLDGGTIENNFRGIYKSGTTIELTNPTKEGYIFSGWVVASDNSLVSGNTFTMGSEDTTLKATWTLEYLIYSYSCANTSGGEEPYNFTYTGDCEVLDDENYNWRVKFLTSGTFTPNQDVEIDAFLVGGGGGSSGRSGGGGGYTATYKNISITANNDYIIVVGAGGEPGSNGIASSAFGKSVNGGINGTFQKAGDGGSGGGSGGDGENGSGGIGGSNGENGSIGAGGLRTPGTGQSKTTREFGESTGTLYAGGGGGGGTGGGAGGAGGAGGGGKGGDAPSIDMPGSNGTVNTGGGAGGGGNGEDGNGYGNTASGGSGIVVIRNARG